MRFSITPVSRRYPYGWGHSAILSSVTTTLYADLRKIVAVENSTSETQTSANVTKVEMSKLRGWFGCCCNSDVFKISNVFCVVVAGGSFSARLAEICMGNLNLFSFSDKLFCLDRSF